MPRHRPDTASYLQKRCAKKFASISPRTVLGKSRANGLGCDSSSAARHFSNSFSGTAGRAPRTLRQEPETRNLKIGERFPLSGGEEKDKRTTTAKTPTPNMSVVLHREAGGVVGVRVVRRRRCSGVLQVRSSPQRARAVGGRNGIQKVATPGSGGPPDCPGPAAGGSASGR